MRFNSSNLHLNKTGLNCIGRYTLLLFLLLNCTLSSAQSPTLFFEHYTSQNGLSQNSGYAITQDKWGFLWMGTQEGLNRFDGYDFTPYRNGGPDSSAYFSQITSLLTTKDGLLWVGTPNGLSVFNNRLTRYESFSHFFGTDPSLDSLYILKLFEDSKGNAWIITQYDGLFRYTPGTRQLTRFFERGENNGRLTSITEDDHQQVWLCSGNEIFRFSLEKGGHFEKIPFTPVANMDKVKISDIVYSGQQLWIGTAEHGIYLLNNTDHSVISFHHNNNKAAQPGQINAIRCMLKDSRNNIWIGTRNEGLYRYSLSDHQLVNARYQDNIPGSLRKDFVLSLFEDRQGIIWAGLSGGGFAKYDVYNTIFHSIRKDYRDKGSLGDNMLFCLYSRDDENLFIGTQNGGVVKWNTRNNSFQSYKDHDPRSLTHNTVYGITTGIDGKLWLATWGGLCRLDMDQRGATNPFVSFAGGRDLTKIYLHIVHKLRNHPRLLVSGINGLYQFDLTTEKWLSWMDRDSLVLHNKIIVRTTYEDDREQVWLGTEGMGLLKYDIPTNTITAISLPSVYTRNVRYIFAENERYLWLGTDNGLVQYDRLADTILHTWQTRDGLPNDVVYGILPDEQKRLWLSTNKGLSCFDVRHRRFYNYDISYGLQDMEFNTACCYRAKDGTMYFGGIEGLTLFHPAAVPVDKFNPAPVITSFSVMNNPYPTDTSLLYKKQVKLSHLQNFFSIEFAALNFSHTTKTVYAYQLKGVDPDWVYCGNRHTASYTKLPPGKYEFQVKAANGNGNWNPELTTLNITILPAFWQTSWFLAAIGLVLAGLIWYAVWKWIRNIRHEAALKHTIAETEMMALRAQMNPHFIFNCINSIDALIQSNDKYHATIYLNKFAKLIRNILDSSKQNMVTLAKDLDTLKLYIELEQLRNENKFTAEIKADDSLLQDDYKVPPLIVQPYVENAILHGLRNRPDNNGKLSINVSRRDDHIEYIIEDNGVGRQAGKNGTRTENQSYGMDMTRDRVKLFNKETAASVIITDLVKDHQPAGTKIQVLLKIQ